MLTLRPYQERALELVWKDLCETKRALVSAPCGIGKGEIFMALCKRAIEVKPDVRILVLLNRTKLILQTARRFIKAGFLRTGIYAASTGFKQIEQITIANVLSLKSGEFDLIVIDEAHRFTEDSAYEDAVMLSPKALVAGFSATPYNASGFIYGEDRLFPRVSVRIGLREMINQGYLVKPVIKCTPLQIDTNGVSLIAGDFNQRELSERLGDTDKRAAQVVDALSRLVGRKSVIWSCLNIAHAESIAALINEIEPALVIHSKMSEDEQENALATFSSGAVRHLVFVTIIAEGIDVPRIDAIVVLRPTRSPVLYVQIFGRGLRLFEGKTDCLILDYARVVESLGPLDSPQVRESGRSTGESIPMKFCKLCLSYIDIKAKTCPDCGYEFPPQIRRDNTEHTAAESGMLLQEPVTHNVVRVEVVDYKSKAGNDNFKVMYHVGVTHFAEYFAKDSAWGMAKLRKRLSGLGLSNIQELTTCGITTVGVIKDGKWDRVETVGKGNRESDPTLFELYGK